MFAMAQAVQWPRSSSIELVRSFFGKEEPRPLQLYRRLRSRDRLGQPMGPLHRKIDIIRRPGDEGWSLQLAQLRLDRQRVLVVECDDEALQVPRTLFAFAPGGRR